MTNCHFLKDKLSRLISSQNSRARRKSYVAILANLLSSLFVSVGVLFLKMSSSESSEISFAVGVCGIFISSTLFTFPEMTKTEVNPRKRIKYSKCHVLITLLLGAVFSGGYAHFYFLSLKFITMGDTLAVSFCVHFVCNLIAECFALKSVPHLVTLMSGVLGLVGLLLICQPHSLIALQLDLSYTLGVAFGTLSGVCGTAYYIGIHKFKNVPLPILQVGYFLGPVVYSAYYLLTSKFALSICTPEARSFAIWGCLFYVFGGLAAVQGAQMSLPSVAALLKLFTILLGYALQITFLSEALSIYSTLGAVLILVSIVSQSFVLVKTDH